MDRHNEKPFMGNTESQHMDSHTENPIMGNTKSQHYNKLVKRIARDKQLDITIPDELHDELARALNARINVESRLGNVQIARMKALEMTVSKQANKAISKFIEVNNGKLSHEDRMKLFGIRKLRSNFKTTAQSKAESELQNVKSRMASTGLAGFGVDNFMENIKAKTNIEVYKPEEARKVPEIKVHFELEQSVKGMAGEIRGLLIHRLESSADRKHSLDSGANQK